MGELINGRTPEEIKERAATCITSTCSECPYDRTEYFCDATDVMDNLLTYAQHLEAQQPKWISVKERLPEETGKYIVCTRKKAVYCTAFRFFHGDGYFATDSNTHITHWMLLPQPPEEEEK